MAKAPASTTETEKKPSGKGRMVLIIVGVVLLVVLIAVAGLVGLLLLKKGGGNGADAAPAAQTPASPTAVDLSRPPTFVSLDPFVVNLVPDEGERYLQVVIALRVADAKTGENLKGFMPEIRHRINLLLSGKLPSELATQEGREALAMQIADEVNQLLGAPPARPGQIGSPIQSVLFNSFIIQ